MAEVADVKPRTIVCFGDSITHGYGVEPEHSFPSILTRLLGVPAINAGVDGDTAADAISRIERDVLNHKPSLVTVEFGANDYYAGASSEDFALNIERIVSAIRSSGADAVVISLGQEFWGAEFEAVLRTVADVRGCRFLTGLLEGILDNPAMTLDGIHPNVPGYIIIARRVSDFLTKTGGVS